MKSSPSRRNINIKQGFPRLTKTGGPWRKPTHTGYSSWNLYASIWRHFKTLLVKLLRFVRHYHLHYAALIALICLSVLQVTLLVINGARSNSPIIGLHFHGENITRFNRHQVTILANAAILDAEKHPVSLNLNNTTVGKITARQLGARYTTNDVVNGIYSFGRDASPRKSMLTQDKVLFQATAYRLGFPNINQRLTTQYLNILNRVRSRSPVNASLQLNNNDLSIKKEQLGYAIDIPKAITKLQNYDASVDGQTLVLPIQKVPASITRKDISKVSGTIHQVIDKPVVIEAGNKTLNLGPADLINCLQVIKSSNPRQPDQSIPTLTFVSGNIDRVAAKIVHKVNADPLPRIMQGVTVITPGHDGMMIDGTETKVSLLTLLISRMNQLSNGDKPLILHPFPVTTVTLPKTTQTNLYAGQIAAYKNNQPAVTFSFSGVPNSTYTRAILNALVKKHVSAIFMLTGRNVVTYPDIVKEISSKGQRLGLTTYSYHDISSLSPDKLTSELDKSKAVIAQASGTNASIFQAPYNRITSAQISQAQQRGYETLPGTLDALDWANIPEAVIVKEVADRVKPGSVILFHAVNHTTADVIPAIVTALHQKGYTIN